MKAIKFLFAFFIFSSTAYSQDWSLFPLNQQSFYKYEDLYPNGTSKGSYVTMVNRDSIYYSGSLQVSLFNKKVIQEGAGNCYDYFMQVNFGNYRRNLIDILTISNDTNYFTYANDSVYFLPYAQPGDSWVVKGWNNTKFIIITCTSTAIDTILGVLDSVKYFSLHETPYSSPFPLDSHIIILSKHYGLSRFVNFCDFKNHYPTDPFKEYELFGMHDSLQTLGITQKYFHDFLPYHVGDILKWAVTIKSGWNQPYNYYFFRDSITHVFSTPDSFAYFFNRTSGGLGYSVDTAIYTMKSYGNILNSITNTLSFSNFYGFHSVGTTYTKWRTNDFKLYTDTVVGGYSISHQASYAGHDVDTINCTWVNYGSRWRTIIFNDHLGFTRCSEAEVNQWSVDTVLVAASINGNVYGDINLHVGISEIEPTFKPIAFPNPAENNISFNLNGKKLKVEIFKIDGEEVLEKYDYDSAAPLNISALPAGIYFVRLSEKNISYVTKFVKVEF